MRVRLFPRIAVAGRVLLDNGIAYATNGSTQPVSVGLAKNVRAFDQGTGFYAFDVEDGFSRYGRHHRAIRDELPGDRARCRAEGPGGACEDILKRSGHSEMSAALNATETNGRSRDVA